MCLHFLIMVYCCVPFCTSNESKTQGIRFHQFPVNENTRPKWIAAISREDKKNKDGLWRPSDRSVVCSRHFRPEDYKQGLKVSRLLPEAVPNIFDDYPPHKLPKCIEPRRALKKRNFSEICANTLSRMSPPALSDITNFSSIPIDVNDLLLPAVTPKTKDKCVGCNTVTVAASAKSLRMKTKKLRAAQRTCQRLTRKVLTQTCKLTKLKEEIKNFRAKDKAFHFSGVCKAASEGSEKALFMLEQMKAFGQKRHRWSDNTIRYCILWHSKSPSGYRFIRGFGILSLPSKRTLKRHIGVCTGKTVTSLMKQRLIQQSSQLKDEEKCGSLIIDEMAIKPSAQYMKQVDEVLGSVSMNGLEKELGIENRLANHLLCFVFTGLSTHFRLPVGYFFTNSLRGEELHKLTLTVVTEVESAGFCVIRIVTDNLSVNCKMFSLLCNGQMKYEIPHPVDKTRSLFLAFDQCHIIKNLRSLLLSEIRNLCNNGVRISPSYIRALYHMQKDTVVKPVRRLSYKHVYPSNLEKMHVGRAIDIFSVEVIGALKYLQQHGSKFGVTSFVEANGTIEFLEMVHKWFAIHNVKNRVYHMLSKNKLSMQFFSINDERLNWLENDFLHYFDTWKNSCQKPAVEFISDETYSALKLTTLSTVHCIRYLLNNGFQYVLTRKFTSDEVESLFSSIRQLGGGNDQANAASVVQALHKILTVGLVASSNSSNVQNKRSVDEWMASSKSTISPTCTLTNHTGRLQSLLSMHLKNLTNIPGTPITNMKSATIAYIAGYIVRAVENNIKCYSCSELLSGIQSQSPVMGFLKNIDRGGLIYPKPQFVSILVKLESILHIAIPYIINKPKVLVTICNILLPFLVKNPFFSCSKDESVEHTTQLVSIILTKFIRPYISNYTVTITDQYNREHKKNMRSKPLSRKVLKL